MLSPKQQKFVDRYLECGIATQAYKDAGYNYKNENTAKACASRLLTNANVREALKKINDKVNNKIIKKLVITRESLINDTEIIKQRCMQGVEVFDKQGHSTGEWRFEGFAALKAVEMQGKFTGVTDGPPKSDDDTGNRSIISNRVRGVIDKLRNRAGK